MKKLALIISMVAIPALGNAGEPATNFLDRVTLSARFGFNLSARFRGLSTLPATLSSRSTPRGDRYNYDDGYVLTDISGNANGQTWYWGYDNSASQVSGNTILLSRTTVSGGAEGGDSEDASPSLGAELQFRREFAAKGKFHFGLEAAANYQNLSVSSSSAATVNATRTTDTYPYTAGTTPPSASSSSVYQGSYQGPGFVIRSTPVSSSSSTIANGATLNGSEHLDANIYGFRLGPYVELPLSDRWAVSLSGGVALGILNPSVSWSETVTISGGGSGTASGKEDDSKALFGGYLSASVNYQISDRWSVGAGLQYQLLQNYRHSFGGQDVEINLRNSVYFTVGIGFSF